MGYTGYLLGIWALIQYNNIALSVEQIPLWRWNGRKVVLFPQWGFLYFQESIFILNQPPVDRYPYLLTKELP